MITNLLIVSIPETCYYTVYLDSIVTNLRLGKPFELINYQVEFSERIQKQINLIFIKFTYSYRTINSTCLFRQENYYIEGLGTIVDSQTASCDHYLIGTTTHLIVKLVLLTEKCSPSFIECSANNSINYQGPLEINCKYY